MFHRNAVAAVMVVAAFGAFAGPVYAQGDMGQQCREVGQERSYPCRLNGDVMRSERQHRAMVRFADRVERRRLWGNEDHYRDQRDLREALEPPRGTDARPYWPRWRFDR